MAWDVSGDSDGEALGCGTGEREWGFSFCRQDIVSCAYGGGLVAVWMD